MVEIIDVKKIYTEKENAEWDAHIDAQKRLDAREAEVAEAARELPRAPDFKGQMPVSVWRKTDRNGKEYIKVVIGGLTAVNCFQPKQDEKKKGVLE